MQQILVYITLCLAAFFLIKKLFFPAKKEKNKCDTDCSC
jgi:hypothetical protein